MGRLLIGILALAITLLAMIVGYNWYKYGHVHGDQETVSFMSADGARFHGTLLKPRKPGPHPVIIILHGSGPSSGLGMFASGHANTFMKQGIAVLVYDKRGSGQSGGDFETATYADFIEDALASIEMLRKRTDIKPDQIALFGSSESGWFTPEIAERSPVDISFIINRAGPPLNWIQTNLWEVQNELISAGLTDEEEIETFLDLRERIWRYYVQSATSRDPLPEVRASLNAELSKIDPQWLKATGMRLAEYEQEKFERYMVDILYDPAPYLERLDIPLFALHGGADQNVPTAAAIAEFKRLRDELNKDIEYVVYPGYKHGMGKYRNVFSMGYPPSYLPRIGRWARKRFNENSHGCRSDGSDATCVDSW